MLLRLQNISFSYPPAKKILDNISLSLEAGKIYALMGANGAGKSTLFNIINGFLKPESGSILLGGKNITALPPFKRNLAGIGRTFQDLRLAGNLSVQENIEISYKNRLSDKWYNSLLPNKSVSLREGEIKKKSTEILSQFHLLEVKNNLAGEISYGQQKLLAIACCVANDAKVLLLDESVAGIMPVYREQLTEILKNISAEGKAILLIEHNTDFINDVADRIFFLANGKIKEYPNLAAMKQDAEVINAYM